MPSRVTDAPKQRPLNGLKRGDRLLTDDAVIEAMRTCFGIKAAAARRLNVSASTLFAYLAERPQLQAQLAEIEEEVGDIVEGKLLAAINRGDIRAIVFYCSTKLKKRGYSTRTEMVGDGGGPIVVQAGQPSVEEVVEFLAKLAKEREERQAKEMLQ